MVALPGDSFRAIRSLILLPEVSFPKGDTTFGIAVGYYGSILRTIDGGTHWLQIPSGTTRYLKGVCFLDPQNVITVGEYGTILKSTDGGLNWRGDASGTTKHFQSVSFATPNYGWQWGDSGIAMYSTNAGSSWTVYPFSKKFFFPVCASRTRFTGISGSTGISRGLYATTDGGVTWDNRMESIIQKFSVYMHQRQI